MPQESPLEPTRWHVDTIDYPRLCSHCGNQAMFVVTANYGTTGTPSTRREQVLHYCTVHFARRLCPETKSRTGVGVGAA